MKQPLIAALLLVLSWPVLANPGGGPGPGAQPAGGQRPPQAAGPGPQGPMTMQLRDLDRLARPLGLTQTQVQECTTAISGHMRKLIGLRAQEETLRLDLELLMRQDQPDQAQVTRVAQALAEVRSQSEMERIQWVLDTRAILTAEQRQQLRDLQSRPPGPPGPGAPGGGRPRVSEGEEGGPPFDSPNAP